MSNDLLDLEMFFLQEGSVMNNRVLLEEDQMSELIRLRHENLELKLNLSRYQHVEEQFKFLTDITERKLAEAKLRESEELFNKSFKHSPVLMSLSRVDNQKFVEVNDAWLGTFGFKRDEVINHTPAELNLWANESKTNKGIEALKDKKTDPIEIELINSFGNKITLLSSIEKVSIQSKDYYLSTGIDITKRKEAENSLVQSEERFSKVFQFNPVMMAIVNKDDGRYIDVNNSWQKSLGLSREEVLGHTSSELNLWLNWEDHQKRVSELIKYNSLSNYELQYLNSQGEVRTGLASSELVFIDGNDCFLYTVIDITNQKQMEKEFARLDRLNLIGEMAGSIGHEIRNPMTAVRGFIQLLNEQERYEKDKAYFDLIIEELDRANEIISEYLGMAKDKIVDLQPQYLDEVVKAIYPLLEADANFKGINIKLDLGKPPMPLIDQKEIRQVILNLARNGSEAMSPNGTLTIGTSFEASDIVLFVKDEGHGLSPEVLDKLGTPFVTTKEKGTGLGLAVCYSIAARHNARLEVETSSNGTTFKMRFPLPAEQDLIF